MDGENTIVSNINAVRQERISNFNNALNLIQDLLPDTVISNDELRQKKALLSWIGSLVISSTGLNIGDELKQITNQMNTL